MFFRDRKQAGQLLAEQLEKYRAADSVVLALPRGGVVIGWEIAKRLKVPLDVVIVRKLTVPSLPEFGIGAIAESGAIIIDRATIGQFGISREQLDKTIRSEKDELKRRLALYRGKRKMPDLAGKTVILVDDGLATGVTAQAAVKAVRKYKPKEIVLAVPVCATETFETLQGKVDSLVCLEVPREFSSVGAWYQDFTQVTDKNVVEILSKSRALAPP